MKHRAIAFVAVVVFMASLFTWAQNGAVQVQPEDQLAKYLPATVFLDGENVPTQKRNAVLVEMGGKKTIVSLIDTAGYSSAYQEKYTGVILTQDAIKIGSRTLMPGVYALGETKVGEHDNAKVTLHVYDIGGKEIAEIATMRENEMKGVRPVQVSVAADGAAQLYLGPYHTSIGPAK